MVIGSNRTMEPKKKFPERFRGGKIGRGWFEREFNREILLNLYCNVISTEIKNAISEREGGDNPQGDVNEHQA